MKSYPKKQLQPGDKEAPLSGTPLSEWPILKRAQIAELNYRNIRTVEDLADLSDLAVQNLGLGGQILRARACAYLGRPWPPN
jgi:hypothetical protein